MKNINRAESGGQNECSQTAYVSLQTEFEFLGTGAIFGHAYWSTNTKLQKLRKLIKIFSNLVFAKFAVGSFKAGTHSGRRADTSVHAKWHANRCAKKLSVSFNWNILPNLRLQSGISLYSKLLFIHFPSTHSRFMRLYPLSNLYSCWQATLHVLSVHVMVLATDGVGYNVQEGSLGKNIDHDAILETSRLLTLSLHMT